MSFKRWNIAPLDKEGAAALAEECEMHPFLALMLSIRGIDTMEAAADYLMGGELEDDPFAFADMDAAVERIQRALDNGERIAVYGDYDCDGVTSTALLYSYLVENGADALYYIPEREGEGYGMHPESVQALKEKGVQLIVTVDNGVSAAEEVKLAAELGMDVVVTDHHMPPQELPPAVAVVDPHRADCGSVCKDYAGVGVAFKLVCALDGDTDAVLERYADLVALGTMADVMPLKGENRKLVRLGLRRITEGARPGLKMLAKAAGAWGKEFSSTSVAFTLAPRINAAGRMGSPEAAARLLLCGEETEAESLAQQINDTNIARQAVEAEIQKQVQQALRERPELLSDRVMVVAGEEWHPGVIGIIAARVTERYGKPCLILTVKDGEAKGSGRSIPGFSLFEALQECADVLERYGGHELAAGISLKAADIEAFRRRINAYAAARHAIMPVPELRLDCRLKPSQIDLEKISLLTALEPCGTGNPPPLFGLYNMRLDNVTPVGGGKHLRLSLSRDGARLSAMKFKTTAEEFPVECGALLHLAVTLEKNEYKGNVSISAIVRDLRYADTDEEEVLAAMRAADHLARGEALTAEQAAQWTPGRDQVAILYRFLRQKREWRGSLEQLIHTVRADGFGGVRIRLALETLRQAALISVDEKGDTMAIGLLPAAGKADLAATPVMRRLSAAGGAAAQ
ncbi:MAG: single-stranded-DNA-specific exonuclease RecJ [Clostridiales bacterium]|nr:single-stranded-DNA-specific exonuclease RecJ [Clostridiales bacterium]